MKVSTYHKKYYWHVTKLQRGLKPPFKCPWATPPDCCPHESQSQKEHQDHIREIHEIPGESQRGQGRGRAVWKDESELSQ